MSYDWNEFRRLSEQSELPDWADAADLSRLSRESLIGKISPVRRDHSSGMIRLLGEGVHGHSAPIEAVALAMRAFQKLITSTSMALEGHYSLRGKPPTAIAQKAQLSLEASPSQGSLILHFSPSHPVEREIAPDGQADFFNVEERMLVDSAVERAVTLLENSKAVGVVPSDDSFDAQLNTVGPRVTSALRNFAKVLSDAQFETEVCWEIPRLPRVQTRMTVSNLHRLVEIVTATNKATETTTIEGVLRTVSDVEFLRLDVVDGSRVFLNAADIPADVIRAFRVGDTARAVVEVEESSGAGFESSFKYKAMTMSHT